jgi:hypothetical protein
VLSLGTIVLGVENMNRAVGFWTLALGYSPRPDLSGDEYTVLDPPQGRGTPLALDRSDTPVQERPRVHLDLYAANAYDQAAEIERLVALGARRVEWDLYPEDPDFVVLADTEGNRFCVVDSSHD